MRNIRKRLATLGLIFTLGLTSFVIPTTATEVHAATESQADHDALSTTQTHNEKTDSGKTIGNYTFKPQSMFFKCVGSTATSLSFALEAHYTYVGKSSASSTKINTEYIPVDGIHWECKDIQLGEIVASGDDWEAPSKQVDLPFTSKTAYNSETGDLDYETETGLVTGIDISGRTASIGSDVLTITGLKVGHQYSVTATIWNKGSHALRHVDEDGNLTNCTAFDTWDTTPYKIIMTANAGTTPKVSADDLKLRVTSTRITNVNAKEQTITAKWNKSTSVKQYNYDVEYYKASDSKYVLYNGNYRKPADANPTIAGGATTANIKIKSNCVNRITLKSTSSCWGLHKNKAQLNGETKYYYTWSQTDKEVGGETGQIVEVIPQVQVKRALVKKNKLQVSWTKIAGLGGADKYYIYASAAGNKSKYYKVGTVTGSTTSFTCNKINEKDIDPKKIYYVYVVAQDKGADFGDIDEDIDYNKKDASNINSLVNYVYRATVKGDPIQVAK